MPYADELVRVAVKWTPPSVSDWGGEQAVTTWHLRHHHITGNGFTWSDQVGHLADSIVTKLITHWGDLSGFHAAGTQIVEVKASHIDAAGHDLDVGAHVVASGTLVGTGSSQMLPPEVAWCVSSWAYRPGTFATRKGRRRGRFYLPYLSLGLMDGHGRVDHGNTDACALGYQSFFNDIQGMHTFNEDTPPDPTPDYWDFVVASKIDATWENVSFLSVDSVCDSQRRRQHQGPTPYRTIETISH